MFLPKNMKHKKLSSNCNYLKEKKNGKMPTSTHSPLLQFGYSTIQKPSTDH